MSDLKKEFGDGLEERINDFVIAHARQVIRSARPDYDAVSEEAQKIIDKSLAEPEKLFYLARAEFSDMYFIRGERLIFYREKLKEIDGEMVAGEPLTTLWDDLLSNNLHKEGGVDLPKSKKPEALIKRVLELSTAANDLVLDAYLGSGTAAAVAHKMGRRHVCIERGEHAISKCQPRLKSVVEGEQSGVSKEVGWKGGGGFRFYKLGSTIFDEEGNINPKIRFLHLASHIWFCETKTAYKPPKKKSPLLGVYDGTAYYLLYNGILGDKTVNGGNVLTHTILKDLTKHDGPKVIYGETSRISTAVMKSLGITFKQTPYDVKAG